MQLSSDLFRRARYVLRTQGPVKLIDLGLTYLRRQIADYGTFYLYEHTVKDRSEADFLPRIKDFQVEVVSGNQEADDLAARGLEMRTYSALARRKLDKGGTAVCIFVKGELAHVGWMATTAGAKSTCDDLPYFVDFAHGQGCTGGTVTMPKFEGNGFMTYGYFKRLQLFKEKGFNTTRNAVMTDNVASQKVHAKFGPRIYARASYLRILGWTYWRETPITGPVVPAGREL